MQSCIKTTGQSHSISNNVIAHTHTHMYVYIYVKFGSSRNKKEWNSKCLEEKDIYSVCRASVYYVIKDKKTSISQ